jgi:hypothetical protein
VDAIDRTILAAADYMWARGWCRGQSEDSRGRVCISGAVEAAVLTINDEHAPPEPGVLFGQAIERIEGYHGGVYVVTFNDYQCKSKREALAFMRAAVKQQQGRQ